MGFLVILGIVILIASFVIALFSLIREERRRERITREQEETAGQKTLESEATALHKIAAGRVQQEETQQTTKEEVFPWEQNSAPDTQVPDLSGQGPDIGVENTARDARLPNLSAQTPSLDAPTARQVSGEIKIGDIVKKQE